MMYCAWLTCRNWHAENCDVNQHSADTVDEVKQRRIHAMSRSSRFRKLLPEVARRPTAGEPGNNDGHIPSDD